VREGRDCVCWASPVAYRPSPALIRWRGTCVLLLPRAMRSLAPCTSAPKPAPAKPTEHRAPAAGKLAGKPAKVIDGFDESGMRLC